MNAGQLRHQITIERYAIGSPQRQANGEPNGAWITHLSNVSAAIEPLRGRELFAAQEHHSEATVRFRIRWRDGLDATMRITHRGLYYNVVWVPPVGKGGKNAELELLTSQGVNDG